MTKRGTLLWTLMGVFVFSTMIALLLGASTARTETAEPNAAKALVCTASFFFSFHRDEVIGDTVLVNGRGLVNCKNDKGFTLEEPVIADLELKNHGVLPEGEISLSGNTSAFVIPRDAGQLQDLYHSRDFAWTGEGSGREEQRFVFRGVANDLVIEMGLKSNELGLGAQFDVQSLRLHFDDSAPDLEGY